MLLLPALRVRFKATNFVSILFEIESIRLQESHFVCTVRICMCIMNINLQRNPNGQYTVRQNVRIFYIQNATKSHSTCCLYVCIFVAITKSTCLAGDCVFFSPPIACIARHTQKEKETDCMRGKIYVTNIFHVNISLVRSQCFTAVCLAFEHIGRACCLWWWLLTSFGTIQMWEYNNACIRCTWRATNNEFLVSRWNVSQAQHFGIRISPSNFLHVAVCLCAFLCVQCVWHEFELCWMVLGWLCVCVCTKGRECLWYLDKKEPFNCFSSTRRPNEKCDVKMKTHIFVCLLVDLFISNGEQASSVSSVLWTWRARAFSRFKSATFCWTVYKLCTTIISLKLILSQWQSHWDVIKASQQVH